MQPVVVESLHRGKPHLFELGVEEAIAQNILVDFGLSVDVDAAIISVSTLVDRTTCEPDLRNLAPAPKAVAKQWMSDTLVVVRSPLPVGASREVVLPQLVTASGSAHVVMA